MIFLNLIKSYLNGLLALPLGVWEFARWCWLSWFERRPLSYETVKEIWLDRSKAEVFFYILGQFSFLAWPAFLCYLRVGSPAVWRVPAYVLAAVFATFTLITLLLPIGARKRYSWGLLSFSKITTGYERLFLGQMQPDLLLSAKGYGARACLTEVLWYMLLILFVAASTQYAIWSDLKDSVFVVSPGMQISPWSFIYLSAITMSTTGYGDITPKRWDTQLVSVLEIVLGWMYLAGLLPSLINLALSKRKGDDDLRFTVERDTESYALQVTVQNSVRWLQGQQGPWGGWRAELPADLAASSCAYSLLSDPNSDDESTIDLRNWLTAELTKPGLNDPVGRSLAEMSLGSSAPTTNMQSLLANIDQLYSREEHTPMLLGLLGYLTGRVPTDTALGLLPDDLNQWEEKYGTHWATYALIGNIIKRSEVGENVDQYARELVRARNSVGSWYDDVLLTSLAALVLKRIDYGRTAYIAAKTWIRSLIRKRRSGIPLISGLEVWDTGWVLNALIQLGGSPNVIEQGTEWLARRSLRPPITAWSWSERGKLICCDTSSLVCYVLQRVRVEDVRVESTLRSCLNILSSVQDQHRWPTFVTREFIHYCPIVSSRCISVLNLSGVNKQEASNAVLEDVANAEITSEWFTDPAITEGLVLAFLAPYCDRDSPAAITIMKRIIESASTADALSTEGVASALLGLKEAKYYLSHDLEIEKSIKELSAQLVHRHQLGYWEPSDVGVFGFGRRYKDIFFVTSLAAIALAR